MRPINVEITMGHDIGLSGSYYKPKEKDVLEDYLKAVDVLTINAGKTLLQKQVSELKEKAKDGEYIRAKLQEKDDDIAELKSAVEFLKNKINATVIAERSSKVISDKKGVPKAIEFSVTTGGATAEITT
jgi:small-conductance mechanosensitive channel